jgi:hypothetical protein
MSLKCGDLVKNLKIFNESLFADEEPEVQPNVNTSNKSTSEVVAGEQDISQVSEDEDENKPRVVVQSRYSLRNLAKKKAEEALKEMSHIASDEGSSGEEEETNQHQTEGDDFAFDHLFSWIQTSHTSYSMNELAMVSLSYFRSFLKLFDTSKYNNASFSSTWRM